MRFSTLFRYVSIALAVLLYGTVRLHAEVKILRVMPDQTDPAIATVHGPGGGLYDP